MSRFYNRDDCLLRGTDWIYKHNSDHSSGFPSFLSVLEQTLSSVDTQNGSHKILITVFPKGSPPNFTEHPRQCCPPNTTSAQLLSFSPRRILPTVQLTARCLLHFTLLPAYVHQDEQALPEDYQSGQFSVSPYYNNNNNNTLNTKDYVDGSRGNKEGKARKSEKSPRRKKRRRKARKLGNHKGWWTEAWRSIYNRRINGNLYTKESDSQIKRKKLKVRIIRWHK